MAFINRAKREEKKRIKEEEKQKKYIAKKLSLERQLYKHTEAMLSKPCALRQDFSNCTENCAHFREGIVWDMCWGFDDDPYPQLRKPVCKLWGKNYT